MAAYPDDHQRDSSALGDHLREHLSWPSNGALAVGLRYRLEPSRSRRRCGNLSFSFRNDYFLAITRACFDAVEAGRTVSRPLNINQFLTLYVAPQHVNNFLPEYAGRAK